MRGLFLGLAVMVLGSVARGEVVVANVDAGTTTTIGNGSTFKILFTTSTPSSVGDNGWILNNLEIFSNQNSTNMGDFLVELRGSGGTGILATKAVTGLTTNASGRADVAFLLTDIQGYNMSANVGYELWITKVTGGTSNTWKVGNTLGSLANPVWTGLSTSNTTSGGGEVNFNLYGTAVPEPGTLLLGGLAAAFGGGGVWWRRKRKAASGVEGAVVAG